MKYHDCFLPPLNWFLVIQLDMKNALVLLSEAHILIDLPLPTPPIPNLNLSFVVERIQSVGSATRAAEKTFVTPSYQHQLLLLYYFVQYPGSRRHVHKQTFTSTTDVSLSPAPFNAYSTNSKTPWTFRRQLWLSDGVSWNFTIILVIRVKITACNADIDNGSKSDNEISF